MNFEFHVMFIKSVEKLSKKQNHFKSLDRTFQVTQIHGKSINYPKHKNDALNFL